MVDIFFYEAFAQEAQALKQVLPTWVQVGLTGQTIQEAGHQQPPARLISVRTQSQIPLSWAEALTAILTRSAGYDHLYAYRNQINKPLAYGYLPEYCSRAVAEQALLLWLALLRKLPQQQRQFQTFNRDNLSGRECQHKTLLVVGVGHIGYQVARIGQQLGMQVLAVDIQPRYPELNYVSIEAGLTQADIIVCAMNLTPENYGYFNYDLLKQARPGVIFVNIARGELSPAADLLRLLEETILGGVALDVYEHESALAVGLRTGHQAPSSTTAAVLALAQHQQVILTPHNAFNTHEATARKAQYSVDQVIHFLTQGQFLWPIPER